VKGSRYSRTCAYCGTEFDIKITRNGRPSKRRYCSKECSVHYKPKNYPWTEPETEKLLELVQSYPLCRLVRIYNLWARTHGQRERTKIGIHKKIRRMGYSTRVNAEYYTLTYLSQMLGIPKDTISGWKSLKTNPLQTYQHDRKRLAANYVSSEHFKEFAKHHPKCLGGAKEVGLQLLLEDSVWAREILREYPKRNPVGWAPLRVRCIETGKIYKSLAAAGRDVYVARQGIKRSITDGHKAGGFHFELV
jgi:hypothetical protein